MTKGMLNLLQKVLKASREGKELRVYDGRQLPLAYKLKAEGVVTLNTEKYTKTVILAPAQDVVRLSGYDVTLEQFYEAHRIIRQRKRWFIYDQDEQNSIELSVGEKQYIISTSGTSSELIDW